MRPTAAPIPFGIRRPPGIARAERFLCAAVAALAVLLLAAGLRAQDGVEPPPEILIINSYAPGYRWSDDEQAGLLAVLRQRYLEIEPVITYLDYKRFPDPAREPNLLADVVAKCSARPPRVIVTLDNAAFDFVLKHRAALGGDGIPLVFGGLNRFLPEMVAGQRNITGVSEESDYSGTFELIQALKPGTRRVLVISSLTESGLASREAFSEHAAAYSGRYDFEYLDRWTNEELVDRLARAPEGTVGLILDVTRDAAGRNNYNSAAFSETLAARTRVPVFITARPPGDVDWSVHVWDGIGGGLVVADLHGATVGKLVLRVLDGERADSIPVVRHSPQRMEVQYDHMERFGLSLDLLPPGTQVTNAPVTFYQVHRDRLVWAGIVFVILCVAVVLLSVNILRRQRAERALRAAEEQLRAAHKMEAIGLLAGGIAHDFNNILQVIRGHAGFLQESLDDRPALKEDVQVLLDAAQRAAQLTRQLLLFSRQEALAPEALDPNEMVAGMAKMLRRVLGEHIELTVRLLPEPRLFFGDKGQLEQVLLNLCLNARDAMPKGGRIAVELRESNLQAADHLPTPDLKPGRYLEIEVSDTGCGMTPEVRRRIFEPFFTTKGAGKGTGLGLAVVYGIVRQHDGAITVQSDPGRGSSFRVLLPFVERGAAAAAESPREEPPAGQGTILVAEDDPQVRAIAERLLTKSGFRVLLAEDGEDAMELIDRHHGEIRLAMLDVLMPRRTGREVHDHLKTRAPGTPVLFCSGYTADMLPPGTAPDPGFALLHKPYSRQELLAAVARALAPK